MKKKYSRAQANVSAFTVPPNIAMIVSSKSR